MTASADRDGRWRSFDLATPVVGLVAVCTFALHGFNSLLSRDLAIYAYAGQQVADGVPPYEGILNRAGPLSHALPALGVAAARLGGVDELLGMRLFYLLLAAACVSLVYLVGRDLFCSRLAGIAAAAAFLSFAGFIEYAADGPREKTPMVLFLVAALWSVTRRRWFAAGLFLSLATLVLQLAFPAAAPVLLVGLFTAAPGRRSRAIGEIILGGLVPVALTLVYFASVGAVGEALSGFLTINARYTASDPITANLAHNWANIRNGYHASLWVIVVGLVSILFLGVAALVRRERRQERSGLLAIAVAAGTVAALVLTYRDFDGWPDLFLLLPYAALGIGGLAREVEARLPQRIAVPAALVWVVVAVTVAAVFSVTHRDDRLVRQRAAVDRALAALPRNASMVAINAPQPLVLSGRTNPTRYVLLTSGLDDYVDDTWPGGIAGFARSVERQRPMLIAVAPSRRRWVSSIFGPEYVPAGSAPGWTWFVNRDVGPGAISALRNR
jgi:4-amino-4-deoxy-L-arabinose transferase-like glycosyltransferase